MRNLHKIFILPPVCLILMLSSSKSAEFKLTNVICKNHNISSLLIHNCRLKAINRHRTIFNFNATLSQPTISITFQGQFFKKANGFKPWLYKFSIDVCRFFRKPYNPVAILVYSWLKDFSNFNHTCPYMGVLRIDGLHIQYYKMPSLWPGGEFLLKSNFIVNKVEVVSVDVFANVVEDS